jgi:hypothetical protein
VVAGGILIGEDLTDRLFNNSFETFFTVINDKLERFSLAEILIIIYQACLNDNSGHATPSDNV